MRLIIPPRKMNVHNHTGQKRTGSDNANNKNTGKANNKKNSSKSNSKDRIKMYEIPIKLFVRMNIRTKETLPEVQAESTDNAENNVIRGKRICVCTHLTQTRYAQKRSQK